MFYVCSINLQEATAMLHSIEALKPTCSNMV